MSSTQTAAARQPGSVRSSRWELLDLAFFAYLAVIILLLLVLGVLFGRVETPWRLIGYHILIGSLGLGARALPRFWKHPVAEFIRWWYPLILVYFLFRAIGSGAAVVPEYNRALTLLELGRHLDAKPVFEDCLVEFDKQGRMAAQGDAHLALAGCAAGRGDWDAWDRHFQQYCQLMRRSGGSDEDTARLAELVGQVTRNQGDPERGRRAWQEALQQWEALQRFEEANHVRALLEQ